MVFSEEPRYGQQNRAKSGLGLFDYTKYNWDVEKTRTE